MHPFRDLGEPQAQKLKVGCGIGLPPGRKVLALAQRHAELFLPGGGMFWVYFGVALPMLGLVTLVYVLAEVGYRDGEVKWSVKAVLERIRGCFE